MADHLRTGPRLMPPARLAGPPGRHRRAVVPLLVALLLLLLGWWWWEQQQSTVPGDLEEWVAVGPRPAGCLRLIIGVDRSGSMNDFAGARDAALGRFFHWMAQGNLRDDDEVAVVDFATNAQVRLPPTDIPRAAGAPTRPRTLDGGGTALEPVLDTVAGFPRSDCYGTLVLLSDGKLGDLPLREAAGRRLLRQADVSEIRLLVPGERVDVPSAWQVAFPAAAPERFDGYDSDATALTFGRTVVDLTGQSLVPRADAR